MVGQCEGWAELVWGGAAGEFFAKSFGSFCAVGGAIDRPQYSKALSHRRSAEHGSHRCHGLDTGEPANESAADLRPGCDCFRPITLYRVLPNRVGAVESSKGSCTVGNVLPCRNSRLLTCLFHTWKKNRGRFGQRAASRRPCARRGGAPDIRVGFKSSGSKRLHH